MLNRFISFHIVKIRDKSPYDEATPDSCFRILKTLTGCFNSASFWAGADQGIMIPDHNKFNLC